MNTQEPEHSRLLQSQSPTRIRPAERKMTMSALDTIPYKTFPAGVYARTLQERADTSRRETP